MKTPYKDDAKDARRYRRLQVLGCAPCGTEYLKNGTVLRFSNLDEFVDKDLRIMPSRGEFQSPSVPPVAEQSEQSQTVNYLQQLQGGMCFVHGRYKEGFHCPHWNVEHPELSTCLTEPQQYGPNPGMVLIPKVAEQYQAEKSDVELLEEAAIAMAPEKSAGIPKCPTCGSDNPKRPYARLLINGRNKCGICADPWHGYLGKCQSCGGPIFYSEIVHSWVHAWFLPTEQEHQAQPHPQSSGEESRLGNSDHDSIQVAAFSPETILAAPRVERAEQWLDKYQAGFIVGDVRVSPRGTKFDNRMFDWPQILAAYHSHASQRLEQRIAVLEGWLKSLREKTDAKPRNDSSTAADDCFVVGYQIQVLRERAEKAEKELSSVNQKLTELNVPKEISVEGGFAFSGPYARIQWLADRIESLQWMLDEADDKLDKKSEMIGKIEKERDEAVKQIDEQHAISVQHPQRVDVLISQLSAAKEALKKIASAEDNKD